MFTSESIRLRAMGGSKHGQMVRVESVGSGMRVLVDQEYVYERQGDLLFAIGEWAGGDSVPPSVGRFRI